MKISKIFDIKHPVIQAPMAGGPTTAELVSRISNLGGLGSVGAGYLSADALSDHIRRIKEGTQKPYSVNIFVNEIPENYNISERVRKKIDRYYSDLELGDPDFDPKATNKVEDQIDVVISQGTPIVSCTFGFFSKDQTSRLKRAGIVIVGTATSVAEAEYVEAMGADAITAQGFEAGGHRGSFLLDSNGHFPQVGGISLIPRVVDQVKVPVLASGGVSDGRSMLAAIALGASGVQMGTVFLTTDEAQGDPAMIKKVIDAKDTDTVLTKVFSGKLARGVQNNFIKDLDEIEGEIPDYPIMNSITAKIRAKAKETSNPELMSLWAGQSSCYARVETAEEAFSRLIREYYYHRDKLMRLDF